MARKTVEQWQALMGEFEASGLNQTAFCQLNNLNPKYFSLKRSKLRAVESAGYSPFVQAKQQNVNNASSAFILSYGSVTLQCDATASMTSLAALIKALA